MLKVGNVFGNAIEEEELWVFGLGMMMMGMIEVEKS